MAAKTPDTVTQERSFAKDLKGELHRRFEFITANIDDTDTWASGIGGIVAVAWEGVNATDECVATYSGETVTFNTSTGNVNGYLHVWSRS